MTDMDGRDRPGGKLIEFATRHTMLVLTLLFGIGTAAIVWHLNQLSEIQIRTTALENSKLYTEALSEFRTLYTSEVAVPAKALGIKVTHDYAERSDAIPLPATLSMMLGNRLGGQGSGLKSRLYSDYPFPWRKIGGGLTDDFSRSAWESLRDNSAIPYFSFEDVEGRASLRYAIADVMRESCIGCHNTHPDTPKNNWQLGETRGILEVITPIQTNITLANDMIRQTFFMLAAILLFSLAAIGFVMRNLRLSSFRSQQLALETIQTNKQLAREVKVRQSAEESLLVLARTDSLTSIANRRKFDEEFILEWNRAFRNETSLAIVLLDIDEFKQYNDNYGHVTGDRALKHVAEIIDEAVSRSGDLAARFGGEEFVILLPDTDLKGALTVAESVRKSIEAAGIQHDFSSATEVITISAGAASVNPRKDADSTVKLDQLLKDADSALYVAKGSGRNCVKG